MKFEEKKELVFKYAAGETDAAETAQAQKLLAGNYELLNYFCEVANSFKVAEDDETVAMFDGSAAKEEFLRRERDSVSVPVTPKTARFRIFQFAGVAASIAVIVSIFLFLQDPDADLQQLYAKDVKSVNHLPDGSIVTLNKGAQVAYIFTNDVREFQLTNGEAFFDVASDANRPFIIEVNKHKVTVLGTSFNVKTIGIDSICVTVIEGLVKVENLVTNESIQLNAGGKCAAGSKNMTVQKVETFNNLFWKTGKLEFENVNLIDALAEINMAYDSDLSIMGGDSDCLLTAHFDNEPVDSVFEIISLVFNGDLIEDTNGVRLHIPQNCQ